MNKRDRFWSSNVKKLVPYVPGEQPKNGTFIKLNTNENPYGPSPAVVNAIKSYPADRLRLYPDPGNQMLRNKLALHYQLDQSEIFVGNGSDEILAFAFFAFFTGRKQAGDSLIRFCDVTYSFYPVYAQLFDISYEMIRLDPSFQINTRDIPADGDGLVIANPNAPTGIAVTTAEIEQLLQANTDRLVLVDEAYVDFGAESCVKLLREYDNLLIVQTFSKSRSLAGLRAGFAMGSEALIDALQRTRDSFNSYTVNSITQAAALAAMDSPAWFEQTRSDIIKTREWTSAAMEKLGFKLTDSAANFLFATHNKYSAEEIYAYLRKNGILVRHFKLSRISNYLRITIGREDHMKTFIQCLQAFVTS